ncbi:MAG: sugar phosphate isomerase/epimerase family protein [Promethearchaeota archaeon]
MKIGMSTYSVRKAIQSGKLDFDGNLYEFSRDVGLEGLELYAPHLENIDREEVGPMKQVQKDMADYGLEIYGFCVESGLLGVQASPNVPFEEWKEAARRSNMDRAEYCRMWLEVAGALGVPNIRFCYGHGFYGYQVTASRVVDFNVEMAKELYGALCAEAKDAGVNIGFENHGFITSDLEFLKRVLEEVPDLRVCLDLGNLPSDRMPYIEHVAKKKRVLYVHAKTHEFRDDGEERWIDYGEVMRALKNEGFDGWYSIEWEGSRPDEEGGVRKTYELLKKHAY